MLRGIISKNIYVLLYCITTITVLVFFQNMTFLENAVLTILRGTFLCLFYRHESKSHNLYVKGFIITSLLCFIIIHNNLMGIYPIVFGIIYRSFLLFYVISSIEYKKKFFLSKLFLGYFTGSLAILAYGLFFASDLFLGEHRFYMWLGVFCVGISYVFMLLSLINLNIEYNRRNMLLFITCSMFVVSDTVFGLIRVFDRSYYVSLFTMVLYSSAQFLFVFLDSKYPKWSFFSKILLFWIILWKVKKVKRAIFCLLMMFFLILIIINEFRFTVNSILLIILFVFL